jgi:Listeria-Bacteroides repeat domain (List_Bact_rpt).
VSKAATYTATWTETKREYTITWKLSGTGSYWGTNTKDTANKTTSVAYGEVPKAPATPARTQTAEWSYTFNGWTPTVSAVSGDAAYTASWTETKRKYDIMWDVKTNGGYWSEGNGQSNEDTLQKGVEYGTKLTAAPGHGDPYLSHRTFLGWSTSPTGTPSKTVTVTGTARYYAIWGLPYGFTVDPNGGEFKVADLGLAGRTSQYLWTNNFRVIGNTLRFNVRKADGTFTPVTTVSASNMERPGYTLSGWYWGGSGVSNESTNEGLKAPGATYWAQWKENNVTIKYQVGTAGGGNVSRASETVGARSGTAQGSTPIHKAGWHFVGWNTKADGTGTTLATDETKAWAPAKQAVSGWDYSLNVEGTYYAIFAPNEYTIELRKNDGTGEDGHGALVATISAQYDRPWTIQAGHVPDRRGFYFLGYSTADDHQSNPWFDMRPASGSFADKTFTHNLTTAEDADGNWDRTTKVVLYGVWNESRYTIVFHENWGDDTTGTGSVPARIDALYTQQVVIPTNDLARTGYNFANWNTQADGSGTTYKTRGSYTHVGLDAFDDANVRGATVHLYAQWDANQYIVHFDPNISISDPEDKGEWHIEAGDEVILAQYGQEVPIETVFSRPGYEFVGWSFEKNVAADEHDTPIVDFAIKEDGTFDPAAFKNLTTDKLGLVRLYAQWKGGAYTVVFDGNASADRPVEVGPAGALDELEMRFGVAKRLPANTFVCKGYTFKGWNTKADGTGEAYLDQALVQDIPGVKDGKVTLFAQWSPVLSLTSPIDACIEVYIDGMDMYVYEVRAGQTGKWPTDTPNGDGTKDDHEDQFEHGQAALESRTPAKLFIEQIDCIPNLDPDEGMARIFPIDGTPALDSWEDFELEFTALNENTGKRVKVATEFGNSYAFVAGANNNYFIPAYDAATNTPGTLDYTLLLRIPESKAKQPNTVRYSEGPVKIATLMFTCRVAD